LIARFESDAGIIRLRGHSWEIAADTNASPCGCALAQQMAH